MSERESKDGEEIKEAKKGNLLQRQGTSFFLNRFLLSKKLKKLFRTIS